MEFKEENEEISNEAMSSLNQIISPDSEINQNQISYQQSTRYQAFQPNEQTSYSYKIENVQENKHTDSNLEEKKLEEENEPTVKMGNRIIKADKPTEGTTIYEKKVTTNTYSKDGNGTSSTSTNETVITRSLNISNQNNIIRNQNQIQNKNIYNRVAPQKRIKNTQIKRYKPKNILPTINLSRNTSLNGSTNINSNKDSNINSLLRNNNNNNPNNRIYIQNSRYIKSNFNNNTQFQNNSFVSSQRPNKSLTSSQSFVNNKIELKRPDILSFNIKRSHSPDTEAIKRKTITRGKDVKNVQITHVICSSKPSDFHITEKLETNNIDSSPIQLTQRDRENLKKSGISSFKSSCQENVKPKTQNLKGKTTVYQHARGIGMTNDRGGNINPLFYFSEIKKLDPIIKQKEKVKVEIIENFRSNMKNSNNTISTGRTNNNYNLNRMNNYNTNGNSGRYANTVRINTNFNRGSYMSNNSNVN
jgi:hypothetical protein